MLYCKLFTVLNCIAYKTANYCWFHSDFFKQCTAYQIIANKWFVQGDGLNVKAKSKSIFYLKQFYFEVAWCDVTERGIFWKYYKQQPVSMILQLCKDQMMLLVTLWRWNYYIECLGHNIEYNAVFVVYGSENILDLRSNSLKGEEWKASGLLLRHSEQHCRFSSHSTVTMTTKVTWS